MAHRSLGAWALALLPHVLGAQGVTTAAVQGTVVSDAGEPVAGAAVALTNTANGRRWAIATGPNGRFLLEAVTIGPYRMEVRALGFVPETLTGIVLTLGRRFVTDVTLRSAAIDLSPITVSTESDPLLDPARAGPADIISRSTIAALPNPRRDFLSLTLLSPQVAPSPQTPAIGTAGGVAFDGQNRVYNRFQIDGGLHQDLYRGALPGRESFPRPLSLDALEEIQVVSAPFDVRYGGFAGGLVNAVTRSGSNAVHGSLFGYLADAALVRRGGIGDAVGDFTSWQLGGTVGGPIMRDRAHYFLSADVQRRVVPDPGPLITDTVGGAETALIGISYEDALRFRSILDTLYGLDPGAFGPVDGREPAEDVFAKISVQLATSSHVEATYHYTHGNRQDFLLRRYGLYQLSSRAQQEPSTAHASRLTWTSLLGSRWSNELIVSFLRLSDVCRPRAGYPLVRVFVDAASFLVDGTDGGCAPSELRQDALEITDNASVGLGRHVLSVGMHAEWLRFRDDLMNNSPGLWVFGTLDSLEIGRARLYQRTLPGPSWAGGVDFRALHVALLAQDRWSPARSVNLTAGLRAELPTLPDAIPTNVALRDSLGVDTGKLPLGRVVWSPRLGINYDVGGAGRTVVRGGIGLFTGRLPYRWISNAYRDDGTHELFLDCRGAQVPLFNPVSQPDTCVSTGPNPRLSAFASDTRLPQNLKLAFGLDHRLPASLVATADVVYTSAVHQLYVTDVNLAPPSGVSRGEADRPLYGTINAANGRATPTRVNGAFDQVILVSNRRGDHALSISTQLRTRSGGAIEGSALYAYTRARDRMSLAHIQARVMHEGTVLDGTLEHRRLGVSLFEIPHRVQVMATVRLPLRSTVSLLYAGASGRPFTYVVNGDANADGLGIVVWQDPVYVPQSPSPGGDVSLVVYDSVQRRFVAAPQASYDSLSRFIDGVPCLREQRGRLLTRNSCRNPWFGTLNARATTTLRIAAGHALQLSVDAYNVLNLIDSDWGVSRVHAQSFGTPLLALRGYDTANGRGIYEFANPQRDQLDDLASRWQLQLGARYVF